MRLLSILNWCQRQCGRSSLLTRAAVLIRNQANCVIGYSITQTPDPAANGEEWLTRVVAPHCRRFADVGANVGNWVRLVLPLLPADARGLAFEPSLSAGGPLRAAIDGRVEVVVAAVGDRTGELAFAEEPGAGETSSLLTDTSRPGAVCRTVTIVTLDAALVAHGWDGLDLLKIDTEGYDFNVLLGAEKLLAAQAVAVVQFEYNDTWAPAGSTLTRARRLLEGHGYRLFVLRPGRLVEPNWQIGEYFRYSNYVALSPVGAGWFGEHLPAVPA